MGAYLFWMKGRTSRKRPCPSIKKTRAYLDDPRDFIKGAGTASAADLLTLPRAHPGPVREYCSFDLSGPERMRVASFLFAEGPDFVLAVVAALSRQPALFAHVGVDSKALGEKQERAQGYLGLADLLQVLADRRKDLGTWEQADANQIAMKVVRQVRGENTLPVPPAGGEVRAALLTPAEQILADRFQQKARGKGKPRQTPAPDSPPQGPGREPDTTSPHTLHEAAPQAAAEHGLALHTATPHAATRSPSPKQSSTKKPPADNPFTTRTLRVALSSLIGDGPQGTDDEKNSS